MNYILFVLFFNANDATSVLDFPHTCKTENKNLRGTNLFYEEYLIHLNTKNL